VRAIHRYDQVNSTSHIQAITVNEDFTKILLTSSDKVLILYKINVLADYFISDLTQ